MKRFYNQYRTDDVEKVSLLTKVVIFSSIAIVSLAFVYIIKYIWPHAIPFEIFQFWRLNGTIWEVTKAGWPLYTWAFVLILIVRFAIFKLGRSQHSKDTLVSAFNNSLVAGFFEEIIYRWLFFYLAIVGAKIGNYLFFGILGFGIPEWIYLHIVGPFANFMTLGILEPYLFSGFGWFIGAAILSSNRGFREGHAYIGWFTKINAWFIGMFLFHIMFVYGLIAAMIIHFVYDLIILGNAVLFNHIAD